MDLILIPPKGLYGEPAEWMLKPTSHMVLAHLLKHADYRDVYRLKRKHGSFVMLDNGAAEYSKVTNEDLLRAIELINPHEVVIPDVMRDPAGTRYAVKEFLNMSYIDRDFVDYGRQYLGVIQGQTKDELRKMVDFYSEYDVVTTLGIPRWLLSKFSRAIRIDMANWIQEEFPNRFQLHLLGTNPLWVKEVYAAAKYASHIRSVDTSLPFNYAIYDLLLTTKVNEPVHRPAYYFDADQRKIERHPAYSYNIRVIRRWASGKDKD